MREYWGHTLAEEAAGYAVSETDDVFRVDMHECPSKGFLLRNGLHQYSDYCDHCMGWIGPLLKDAAYTVDHQHNHKGKCWWELRKDDSNDEPSSPGQLAGESDVRLKEDWDLRDPAMDTYRRSNHPDDKERGSTENRPSIGTQPALRLHAIGPRPIVGQFHRTGLNADRLAPIVQNGTTRNAISVHTPRKHPHRPGLSRVLITALPLGVLLLP